MSRPFYCLRLYTLRNRDPSAWAPARGRGPEARYYNLMLRGYTAGWRGLPSRRLRVHRQPAAGVLHSCDCSLLLVNQPDHYSFQNWRQLLSSQPERAPKIEILKFGVWLNSGFFQLGTEQLASIFEKNNGQGCTRNTSQTNKIYSTDPIQYTFQLRWHIPHVPSPSDVTHPNRSTHLD